jgi:hypothetical protein
MFHAPAKNHFTRRRTEYRAIAEKTKARFCFGTMSMKKSNKRKSSPKSFPSLSLRIDLGPQARIGPGKIRLLENIHSCGSISAAGRAKKMSYRRMWLLVGEIHRICGHAVVETQQGGNAFVS